MHAPPNCPWKSVLALRTDVAIRMRRTIAIDDRTAIIIIALMRTAAAWR